MSIRDYIESLDERSRQVLFAVIESYIHKPEPVGSRFVTKKYPIGFSPATIRNIMSDLEEAGLLAQPHTSAGRVPTDKGYRYYVDALLNPAGGVPKDSYADTMQDFARRLDTMKNDLAVMFHEVTDTLSRMSNYVGVALPPQAAKTTFHRIDLMRYRDGNVVAILLTDEGLIRNKIIKVDSELTQGDLNRIADYLNSEYRGRTIDEMTVMLVALMQDEKTLWDSMIRRAIEVCKQTFNFNEGDLYVSGLYDAMDLPEFSDIGKIRQLSRAIKDKHTILRLLDEFAEAEGVNVIIGRENASSELQNLSIVAASCRESGRPMGVIALIGPTRMDYSKAIFMVDMVARQISRTFDEHR
ncbi:MAG TPA: heat-inducible transcriptional repressor HrcA [Dissulfurispiraceae bacterium]|nr:heat-inducible transcriptional repressor HrcA [Dissulfurispiraceae bacterium]